MKTLILVVTCGLLRTASAQLLPTYNRSHSSPMDGACVSGLSGHGSAYENYDAPVRTTMHAEERSGVVAKEMLGDGSGTMISMNSNPWASTSFGFLSGSYYLMRAGASVVPMFAQVRQNFWSTRSNEIYGAAYGYAAGGPALGIGQSLTAPSFGAFLRSMTLRFGAGAMTGVGAELGGSAFGWSLFTEAGAMGFAYTAKLGPHSTYAAPFLAFGLRRAF